MMFFPLCIKAYENSFKSVTATFCDWWIGTGIFFVFYEALVLILVLGQGGINFNLSIISSSTKGYVKYKINF